MSKQPGWKTIPPGGVGWIQSENYLTGEWRGEETPILDKDKCTKCLLCWIYCPDVAINYDGKDVIINYDFCKGCGICAHECPVNAIEMAKE